MGFPYGRFIYDEMMLAGPGEQGEANAKRITAAAALPRRWSGRPEAGEAVEED